MSRRRLAAASLYTLLLLLVADAAAATEDAAPDPSRVGASSAQTMLRPFEAPIYGTLPAVPPLPPEYLKHDQAGIRFAYHPSARERVRVLIEDADEARKTLSTRLGVAVLEQVDVRVAVGSSDFGRVVPDGAPEGSGVVAFSELGLLVMSLPSGPMPSSEVRAAFRRGMAYLALDEVAGPSHLPRWFRIGFALHFSGEASMTRARSLWWASMQRRLIPLADLDWHLQGRAAYGSVAAAEAADFVRFLGAAEHTDGLARMAVATRQGDSFEHAVGVAYRRDVVALEAEWREDVAKHKAFVPILVGGTMMWVVLAAGIRLRRRWRTRKSKAAAPPKPKWVKAPKTGKSKHKARARMSMTQLPEPDVPKVSHDGRWHTIH